MMRQIVLAGMLLLPVLAHCASKAVLESARAIPLVAEADLVVVGGGVAGVAAACAAAEAGQKVFLAAPRMYLGEDICAPYQLWLAPGEEPDSPLAQAMFADPLAARGIAFTYQTSVPSGGKHEDSVPPRLLNDGMWGSAVSQSVEYASDVTVVADLGSVQTLRDVRARIYQAPRNFAVKSVAVAISVDGVSWTEVGEMRNDSPDRGDFADVAMELTMPVAARASQVRFDVRKADDCRRMLLGELQVFVEKPVDPRAAERVFNTTPMLVKTSLEEALMAAGVDFVYGSPATDVLRDQAGRLAGVVIANRAGRQAIRAKAVLDATGSAWFARTAGARVRGRVAGEQLFRRVVIGGEPCTGAGIESCRRVPLRLPVGGEGPAAYGTGGFGNTVQKINGPMTIAHPEAYEYTLRLPVADGSYAALAEAEQRARDLTFDPNQVEESETLLPLAEESIDGSGVAGYWLAPGCGTSSILTAIRSGRALGAELARELAPLAAPSGVRVSALPAAAAAMQQDGEIREALAGFRPMSTPEQTVASPERALPVFAEVDVLVVGGGTSGAPAAISAARAGAKTLVIDYLQALGGTGTVGLIGIYCAGYRKGFTAEVDRGIVAIGSPTYVVGKQEYWRREIRRAGGDIWFGVLGCGAYRVGDKAAGVVVVTPEGRGVVLAKVVIDGTGNADVAAAAGAELAYNSADDEAMQGSGLPYRAPGASYINTDWTYVDEVDMVDVTSVIIAAKRKFRGAYDLCQLIDTRERRRIVGDYTLDPLDIINQRRYPDTIQISQGGKLDKHGSPVHPYYFVNNHLGGLSYTPYRCILPRGLDGMLVVGLGLSAHRDAIPSVRMQPCLQNLGYAAGLAAAMAAKGGLKTRDIDLKALQAHLVANECLTPDVPEHRDSYPLPLAELEAAAKQLAETDYKKLGLLMADVERSLPLLRAAYASAATPEGKLRVAHILGMLGDGAGIETLIEVIRTTKEYGEENISTYFPNITWLDSYIIAAGFSRDRRVLPVLHERAAWLFAQPSLSWKHVRSMCMALEAQGSRESVALLAPYVTKPGRVRPAVRDVIKDQRQRDRSGSLELVVARVLYNLGDSDGFAEAVLRDFSHDVRGHYRRHAMAVLAQGPGKALRP